MFFYQILCIIGIFDKGAMYVGDVERLISTLHCNYVIHSTPVYDLLRQNSFCSHSLKLNLVNFQL